MKKITLLICMAALVMLFTAPAGFSQAFKCATYPSGSTPTIKIAVAANFVGTSSLTVQNFLVSTYGVGEVVQICQGSTGALAAYIQANPGAFDMFFGADTTATQLSGVSPAFIYARGLPVLFGYTANSGKANTITDVSDLLTQSGTSFANVLSYNVTGYATGYSIPSSANDIAIADSSVAPYGQAAEDILDDMGNPPVTLVSSPGQDVSAAFSAVGNNGVNSGFVSKAQICSIFPIVTYVQFTGYTLTQMARQLTTAATPLYDYIQSQITSGAWNTFISLNCYNPI